MRGPALAGGLWFGLMPGCGAKDGAPSPQSQPATPTVEHAEPLQAQRIVLPMEPLAVPIPVGPDELSVRFPALGALSLAPRQVATAALNLVPGPCTPCVDAGEHLARCALRPPSDVCANIPILVQRAVTLAAAGGKVDGVREGIHYPDIWVSLPEPEDVPAGAVVVDLVLEDDSPWAEDGKWALAAITRKFGSRVYVRRHPLHSSVGDALSVRATPTWAIGGYRMRGAQSPEALGRLIERVVAPQVSE